MLKIAVVGVIGAVLSLVLKESHASYSLILLFACCLLILGMSVEKVQWILEEIAIMGEMLGEGKLYLQVLLKMIGIAYVAELGADLCRDAGAVAVAGQIEFFGKIMLLAVSMPIMKSLVEVIGTISGSS